MYQTVALAVLAHRPHQSRGQVKQFVLPAWHQQRADCQQRIVPEQKTALLHLTLVESLE